jgi:nucleoside-diphosphate kinase
MISEEKTLFLIKPDAVKRGIVGEILQRLEKVGLKIVAAKLTTPDNELASNHYPAADLSWLESLGKRSIEDCQKYGIDTKEGLGTSNPIEIGKLIVVWNMDYLKSGPVFAFVFQGFNAVERLRSIVGNTIPVKANPGTIRGDYSLDSAISANIEKRSIHNIVHASGTVDEAKREIDLWFKPEEICQ